MGLTGPPTSSKSPPAHIGFLPRSTALSILPFGHEISPPGGLLDAFPAWGKGGLLGAAPLLGPLCTSPGAPPKKRFQFPSGHEGNASPAAGASLTRFAHSGDLPPRRVNARGCFHFDQYPLQPTSMNTITGSGDDLVPFRLLQDICASQT